MSSSISKWDFEVSMAMIKGGLKDMWGEDEADIRDSEMEEEFDDLGITYKMKMDA